MLISLLLMFCLVCCICCSVSESGICYARCLSLVSPLPSTTSWPQAWLVRRLRSICNCLTSVPVYHRCMSLDFRCLALPSRTDKHGISRLPLKVLARMLSVSDRALSICVSRLRRLHSCLPLISTSSHPEVSTSCSIFFQLRSLYLSFTFPSQRFTSSLAYH